MSIARYVFIIVKNGEATDIEYKLDAGKVYVNGFAIQTSGFATPDEAYTAYVDQWGATQGWSEKQILLPAVSVTTQAELDAALTEIPAGKPTRVELKEGTYTLPALTNKDVTFTGTKETVIDLTESRPNTNGANITFDGVTVEFANANYQGLTHTEKVVYRNAKLVGQQTLYAPAAEFISCEFEVGNGYNVWTYGATDVTFTDCKFTTEGRAIMVYNEMKDASFEATITLNNCKFSDNGTYVGAKAVVETGVVDLQADNKTAKNTATSNRYNLIFNGCSDEGDIVGFEENNSTSPLWGNKNSMDKDHLNVIINGEDVY